MGPGVVPVAGRSLGVPPPPRELDLAAVPAAASTIVVRARSHDVHLLVEAARALIGGKLAEEEVVRRVWSKQPDSLWAFFQDERMVGGFAMFMLNAAGAEALLAGNLDASEPGDEYLAGSDETPHGIYLWAIAHSGASDGVLKMFTRLHAPPYNSATIYGAPVTRSGREFLRKWGFVPVPDGPPNLFQYIRRANRPIQHGG
jgi:hypothetical protein